MMKMTGNLLVCSHMNEIASDFGGAQPDAVRSGAVAAPGAALTEAGRAALDSVAALARKASAPATLRAYRSDWAHYAAWCARMGFSPVPAAPATVGAYLASLTDRAPNTVRRRLAALGKMHRFNDLPWNPPHRDIRGPLDGLLREKGRPVAKAVPLTLAILRQLHATCDVSARGRRDRALLLFGFAGALRRSELVALRVEDVAEVAGGLRLRILRGKTDQAGQGPRSACRGGAMSRPVPCGLSTPGRRSPNGAPARCFAGSAPVTASAMPRSTPMRCAAFLPIAWPWPGSRSRVSRR